MYNDSLAQTNFSLSTQAEALICVNLACGSEHFMIEF